MADKTIESINHNYEPVNKYIDDQARLKRSVSSWRYAKSTALVLVAAGILAVFSFVLALLIPGEPRIGKETIFCVS